MNNFDCFPNVRISLDNFIIIYLKMFINAVHVAIGSMDANPLMRFLQTINVK